MRRLHHIVISLLFFGASAQLALSGAVASDKAALEQERAEDSATSRTGGGVWICWYDGAPLRRSPVEGDGAVVRKVREGAELQVEAIEKLTSGVEWLRIAGAKEGERLWIPLAYCRRVWPANAGTGNLPIGKERVEQYQGLPLKYRPDDMARLPEQYCYNDVPQRLRKEAAEACMKMLDTAREETGRRILVLSAFRTDYTQAWLCKSKIDIAGIMQGTVARPGHSEHQLGTTVDLVGDEGTHMLTPEFDSTPEGKWLRENCERFGFVRTYTKERADREAVAYEPWHFRYVGRENVKRDEFQDTNIAGAR